MSLRLTRLSPSGSPILPSECLRALQTADPQRVLCEALGRRLGAAHVTLHASGREALRAALVHLAQRTGRDEVVVPAYVCFSVPAAAVAAGLRVRLVDVNSEGQIDAPSLASLPLERAAALVVGNLFGVPEPVGDLIRTARGAELAVVDDAAQALGAVSPDGPVGGRGDVGILSFGRGKPLSALGGGALAWAQPPELLEPEPVAAPRRLRALARAVGFDLALVPFLFRWLAAIEVLGIGETHFDPGFRRGGIDGASLSLAAALVPGLERGNFLRESRAASIARRLNEETRFRPLLAPAGWRGVFPRLGVLAPSAEMRDAAVEALFALGGVRMYPSALDAIPALRPHLVGQSRLPGASEFSSRLFTLPTHGRLRERHSELIVGALKRLA